MAKYFRMKKYLSEFFGTFALVFAGTGAIVINDISNGAITHVGVSITFGLVVMAMIYTIGDISGAHINPAVTFGFWIARRFPSRDLLPYILFQCRGALFAGLSLLILFKGHQTYGATLPLKSITQSFILEIILTWLLMFVILNISTDAKEKGLMAGVAVGSTVGLESMFAGPISGASMNPARSLGPAIVSSNLNTLWIYILAPLIGSAIAVGSYLLIRGKDRL